jgi:hypothetical protein
MAIITLNNNSLSSVTSLPAGVGGKVLQVVTANTGTTLTTTSTSFVDTGLTASITPSATSNKILILVSMDNIIYRTASGYFRSEINLLRDSTQLLSNLFGGYSNVGTDNGEYGLNNRSYLDSPSSTSSLTYKTQVKINGGGTTVLQESGRKSFITLMEIAG